MRIIPAEQFKKQFGEETYSQFEVSQKGPGYFQRVGQGIKGAFTGLKSDLETQAQTIAEQETSEAPVAERVGKTALALGRSAIRGPGAVARATLTPLTEAPGIKHVGEFVGEKLAQTTPIQKFAEWSQRHPEAAKDIQDTLDIAAFLGMAKTVKPIGELGIKGAKSTIKTIGDTGEGALQKVSQATEKIKGAIPPIVEEVKRLPSRFQTNVAQKQAVQETISKLPSKVAREAAQDGLDMPDIKALYQIPKTQKASLKKLAIVVKDFAEGKTKTNPIEVVGKPIVNRLKELESTRVKIGKQLGDVADDLGKVSEKELVDSVFNELKSVPGLNELSKTMFNKLDFAKTTLATELSKADRMAIRKIYEIAIRTGTGKSKHLLRQELFEILGGKKRALTNLTDTQEKAFDAVRKGLSKVLESKNNQYKELSGQYRQVVQPLREMRNYMKKVVGAEEDIQNMSAGLLARRLTSAAKSNPEIKAVLNAMDKATKIPGKTRLNIETLQDFYNILEKYYDIAPKTGFQSQVRQGVEKAIGGPGQFITEQFKSYLGETPVVRQKALEKILEEIFK